MKRIVSLILTLAMLAGMMATAFADGNKTITITNTTTGHTYKTYEIFTGTLADEPEMVTLTNDEGATKYPVFEIIKGITTYQVFEYEGEYYKVSAIEKPYTPNAADKVPFDAENDTKTPLMIQHMTNMEWGKSVTPTGKAVLYAKYMENSANLAEDVTALVNEFNTNKSAKYNANKDTFFAHISALTDMTVYDYVVLQAVPAYKAANTGIENPTYESVDKFIVESVSKALRGTGDAGAIELATTLKDKYNGVDAVTAPIVTTSTGGNTTIDVGSKDGYFLIEDEITDATATDKAVSRYIVEVAANTVVANKGDAPKVVKKVYDNTANIIAGLEEKDEALGNFDLSSGSEGLDGGFWNDNADYSIGDEVPFKLIGTLPLTYAGYSKYYYKMTDTISDGLTILPESIQVYLLNGAEKTVIYSNGTLAAGVSSDASGNVDEDGNFILEIKDVKTLLGSKEDTAKTINHNTLIVVEYKAKLNENAVVGGSGNTNTVDLTYSNNPNKGGEGETGTTKPDTVVVFTYKAEMKKVDGQATSVQLAGAKFKLSKLTSAGELWWKKDANGKILWVDSKEAATEVTTNGTGDIEFTGLDDGKYLLYETVAPFGYSLPSEPFGFEITSTLAHSQSGYKTTLVGETVAVNQTSGLTGSFQPTDTEQQKTNGDGIVHAEIRNTKQDHLPTTGGMGTTLFYLAGTVLVLGAGLMLVIKKREIEG